MIRGCWCSKSCLGKAAGAEVAVLADRWKMARRCGAKHICKSKCTKHHIRGAILEVAMLKNGTRLLGAKHICKSKCTKKLIVGAIFEVPMLKSGTRLWREAHLQVKMQKNWRCRSHFGRYDVEKWHAAVARSIFWSQNVKKLTGSDHFLKVWCRKIARHCGAKHICKAKCTKHPRFAAFCEVSNWLTH